MKVRPLSVTVIAWILIVMGVIALVSSTVMLSMLSNPQVKDLMAQNPVPIPVQFAVTYAGLLVMIVSGIAMLKGQNWGRLLYVIWSLIGFLIGVATSPMKLMMIPGGLFFAVVVFFLFRPKANQYFLATEATHDPQRD